MIKTDSSTTQRGLNIFLQHKDNAKDEVNPSGLSIADAKGTNLSGAVNKRVFDAKDMRNTNFLENVISIYFTEGSKTYISDCTTNVETCNKIIATFKAVNIAQNTTWKDSVYNQFINLTDWKVEDNLSDWRLVDLQPNQLSKFGKGKVVLLSKSFNQNGCQTDCTAEGENQSSLEAAVKEALTGNGWTLSAGPKEGGAYHDYLYVKDGYPLIMQVGTRNAVTGGMYIVVEFLY